MITFAILTSLAQGSPIPTRVGEQLNLTLYYQTEFELKLQRIYNVSILVYRTDDLPFVELEVRTFADEVICRSNFGHFAACLIDGTTVPALKLKVTCGRLCGCDPLDRTCISYCTETCPVWLSSKFKQLFAIQKAESLTLSAADHKHAVEYLMVNNPSLRSVSSVIQGYDLLSQIRIADKIPTDNKDSAGFRIGFGSVAVSVSPCYVLVFHKEQVKLFFNQKEQIRQDGFSVFSLSKQKIQESIIVELSTQRLYITVVVQQGGGLIRLAGCNGLFDNPVVKLGPKSAYLLEGSQLLACRPMLGQKNNKLFLIAQTNTTLVFEVRTTEYFVLGEGWSSLLIGNTSRNISVYEQSQLLTFKSLGEHQFCLKNKDAPESKCIDPPSLLTRNNYSLQLTCAVQPCRSQVLVKRAPINLKLGQGRYIFLDVNETVLVKVAGENNTERIYVFYQTLHGKVKSSLNSTNSSLQGSFAVYFTALESSAIFFSSSTSNSLRTIYVTYEPIAVSLLVQKETLIKLKSVVPAKVRVESDKQVCFSYGYTGESFKNCSKNARTIEFAIVDQKLLRVESNGVINLEIVGTGVQHLARGQSFTLMCSNCVANVLLQYKNRDVLSVSGDGYILDGQSAVQQSSQTLFCAQTICDKLVELVVPDSALKQNHFTILSLAGISDIRRLYQLPQRVFFKRQEPQYFWFVGRGRMLLFAQAQTFVPRVMISKSKGVQNLTEEAFPSYYRDHSYSQLNNADPFTRWADLSIENQGEESLLLITVQPHPDFLFAAGPLYIQVRQEAAELLLLNQTLQHSVSPAVFLLKKQNQVDTVSFRAHSSASPQLVYDDAGLAAYVCHDSCVFSVYEKSPGLNYTQLHANDPVYLNSTQDFLVNLQQGRKLHSNGSFQLLALEQDQFKPTSIDELFSAGHSVALLRFIPKQPIVVLLSRQSIFVESGVCYNFTCKKGTVQQFSYFASDPFFVQTKNKYSLKQSNETMAGKETFFPKHFRQYKFQLQCDKQTMDMRIDDSGSSGGRPLFPLFPVFGTINASHPAFCVMFRSQSEGGNFTLNVVATNDKQELGLSGKYYVSPRNQSRQFVHSRTVQVTPHSAEFNFDRIEGSYQICLQNSPGDLDLFAVVSRQDGTQVIAPGQKHFRAIPKSGRALFQVVVPQRRKFRLELTSCVGNSKLYGSSNYSKALLGTNNQIENVVITNRLTEAEIDKSRGYFYFAVQAIASSFVKLVLYGQDKKQSRVVEPPANRSVVLLRTVAGLQFKFSRAKCQLCKQLQYEVVVAQKNQSLQKYLNCEFKDESVLVKRAQPQRRLLGQSQFVSVQIRQGQLPKQFYVGVVVRDSQSGQSHSLYSQQFVDYSLVRQKYMVNYLFFSLLLGGLLLVVIVLRVCRHKGACCFRSKTGGEEVQIELEEARRHNQLIEEERI